MNKNEFYYVKMGRDAQTVLEEYYGASLVKFLTNEPLADGETSGGMYLGEIKKYYDEYGYATFNEALTYLYDLQKKESKDNE